MTKKTRMLATPEIKDWKWNPDDMTNEGKKERCRKDPIHSSELVYKVIYCLYGLAENLEDGVLSWFSALCLTKDMWDATNYARLWPEACHEPIDTLLQEALSHIAEAHYMIEGAWAWDKMNATVLKNIRVSVAYAMHYLRKALLEIEFYLCMDKGDDDDDGNEECGI